MTQIYYNNNSNRELTLEVVRQIRNARKWIKACNLFFDDETIRKYLLEALQRGVAVFVLTNLDGVSDEVYTAVATGKKKSSPQSTQDMLHSHSLKQLYQSGAHISGLDGLHAKFLLTDTGDGLLTSLNFTPKSIDEITELGVQLAGKEFDEVEKVFDNLFLRPDRYRFASHDTHFSYECPSDAIDCNEFSELSRVRMTLAPTTRGRGEALSQCDIHDLRDEIFDIINSTENGEDLFIATFSLFPDAKDADGQTLETALLNAKNRGVRLHIVMRKDKGRFIKGLFIHPHMQNHAKVVMNNQRGIIFTGNLTPESFENGFDLGVILTSEQICQTKEFINSLIRQS